MKSSQVQLCNCIHALKDLDAFTDDKNKSDYINIVDLERFLTCIRFQLFIFIVIHPDHDPWTSDADPDYAK